MRKMIFASAIACALLLSGCSLFGMSKYDSNTDGKTLKAKGYEISNYTAEEAKAKISGINFEDVNCKGALFAEKGEGDDKDLFIGFYFDSVDEAEKFNAKNNYENQGLIHDYCERNLGKNLKLKVGSHNNVAYGGSETTAKLLYSI